MNPCFHIPLEITLNEKNHYVKIQDHQSLTHIFFEAFNQELFTSITLMDVSAFCNVPSTPTTSKMFETLQSEYYSSQSSSSPLPLTASRFKMPTAAPMKSSSFGTLSPNSLSVTSFTGPIMEKAFRDFVSLGSKSSSMKHESSPKRESSPIAEQRRVTFQSCFTVLNFEYLETHYVDKDNKTLSAYQFFCHFIATERTHLFAILSSLKNLNHIIHTQPQTRANEFGIHSTDIKKSRSFSSKICPECENGATGIHYRDFPDDSIYWEFFARLSNKSALANHSITRIYESLNLLYNQGTKQSRFISPFLFAFIPQSETDAQCLHFLESNSIIFPESLSAEQRAKNVEPYAAKMRSHVLKTIQNIESFQGCYDPNVQMFGRALEERELGATGLLTVIPGSMFTKIASKALEHGFEGKHGFKHYVQSDPKLYNEVVEIIKNDPDNWTPMNLCHSLAATVHPTKEGLYPNRYLYPYPAFTTPLMAQDERIMIALHFQLVLVDGSDTEVPKKIKTLYRIQLIGRIPQINPTDPPYQILGEQVYDSRHNWFFALLLLLGYPPFFLMNTKNTLSTEAPLLKGIIRLVTESDGYIPPTHSFLGITVKTTQDSYVVFPAGSFFFNPKNGIIKAPPQTCTPKESKSKKRSSSSDKSSHFAKVSKAFLHMDDAPSANNNNYSPASQTSNQDKAEHEIEEEPSIFASPQQERSFQNDEMFDLSTLHSVPPSPAK